jgi:hypothetical protein
MKNEPNLLNLLLTKFSKKHCAPLFPNIPQSHPSLTFSIPPNLPLLSRIFPLTVKTAPQPIQENNIKYPPSIHFCTSFSILQHIPKIAWATEACFSNFLVYTWILSSLKPSQISQISSKNLYFPKNFPNCLYSMLYLIEIKI